MVQESLELSNATRNARFYGADGHIEYARDFRMGVILQVKEGHGCAERGIELGQRIHSRFGIDSLAARGRDKGDFRPNLIQFELGETGDFAEAREVLAMQSCEEPAFHFRFIPKLALLLCPDPKCLLR